MAVYFRPEDLQRALNAFQSAAHLISIRIPSFSLSLKILNFFDLIFINIEGGAKSENQRIILKSLLMFYLITVVEIDTFSGRQGTY